MKFAVYLLLIGACALVAQASPISEPASPEVEDAPKVEDVEVQVEPEFEAEEVEDRKELPVESSPLYTCGDHNCTEMELLASIMFALNDFTPFLSHKPGCTFAQPPQHGPPACVDCADSQFLIMKVVGLLRSLADLLSLIGAPQVNGPHGVEPKFSEAPCPAPQRPGPQPLDPNFGQAEAEQFDKALDAIVASIMEQIHEEVLAEEESAEDEAIEELEEEEAVEGKIIEEMKEEAKEAAEEVAKEAGEEVAKETVGEEAAKEEERSEEVVKKDLEVTPEEVETFNPEAENETAPPPKPHKKSKKRKSKEPAVKEVAKDEEQEQGSMIDGLMDMFNSSG